ncbi:FAD-binding oxidoreductase [Rhodobacteraceae bacterium NNCM2]|nr:FAD-binding oxidoreductase [Coraliihabitans acroporae]
MSDLDRRLREAVRGDVLFDSFSRGRYATDASIFQIMPHGVVVPQDIADVRAVMEVARETGVPITPRGGGTSQCGQTINESIILDLSRHMNRIISIDPKKQIAVVEPGVVLDELNRALKPYGLWYPIDVSTSSRATIGGMTANNSCGARSIRYGMSRDNVIAIDAILADGTAARFEEIDPNALGNNPVDSLYRDMVALGAREADEIAARLPNVARNVGGYNIDAMTAKRPNMATLLVGSEGTLAFSEKITLKLSPLPGKKVLGICHFPTFYAAMDATQHIVTLDPAAVELFDRNIIELARDIPIFRPVLEEFIRGEPQALLIVEFAEEEMEENLRRLKRLDELMGDLGFPDAVVEAVDPAFQSRVLEVRKQGLNIMMSMKDAAKPVSFIEDCCVELPDLAEYTDRLTHVFEKHGTHATFYAHASVGTLHVRPVLNLKQDAGVKAMRAIAEETFELVREYKGAHSGEHGDGIIRSEFHGMMFGERMVANYAEVKERFDPEGLFNPGRIVDPPRMDDRSLFRFKPDYKWPEVETVFNWPGHIGSGRGLQGAVEMCNNNGACRKLSGDVMCPSYRVTRDEKDLTRGRANTLRLALSGQLGEGAFTSDEMAETMKLCVSCKGCRRECPTGVDMAKMKIEVQAAQAKRHGISLRDRLVGFLPRYAPWASKLPWLMNLRDRIPGMADLSESLVGLSAGRTLPKWGRAFRPAQSDETPDVLLFADTFNRYFEAENLAAAEAVLRKMGLKVGHAEPPSGERPLCCGRTFLSVGLAEEARAEMARTLDAIRPVIASGGYVVGLEPSCIMTFRDEAPQLFDDWTEEMSSRVLMIEEYLAQRLAEIDPPLGPVKARRALVHGHCHQKAFNAFGPVMRILQRIPELKTEAVASSCCGMAGAFGYQAETIDVSKKMAELSLLPKVREASSQTVIVADGTSCRHQIHDGSGRDAVHVVQLLAESLNAN